MENLPKNYLLEFHDNTLFEVRKLYDLHNLDMLKASLDLLEDWIERQEHFTKKDFSRDYLERMLISAKGSVEKTKQRLDRTCALRNEMPHYFQQYNVKEMTEECINKIEPVLLPKLTADNTRYFMVCVKGSEFSAEMFLNNHRLALMIIEYARAHDYTNGYVAIFDLRNSNITKILLNLNILNMKDLVSILVVGYGVRVKGIHIITDSNFMETIMKIAKQIVPKKLSNRIHLHSSIESLHKLVPKDVMPIEYGGEEKPLHDIFCDWAEMLNKKEFAFYWEEMLKARTDESKRSKDDKFNFIGIPGTFRNLNVD